MPPTALETLSQPGYWLALGTLLFVLLVFAWPGTPVYDGVRLFLMVFPLWAVFVGAGAKWLAEHQVWRGLKATYRLTAVGIFVALQGAGLVVYHPCQLSHYGLQVGGLRGAERLGFEVSYWGDAVTESLLAEAARRSPGGVLVFGPNLAPFQAPAVAGSSPALVENQVALVSWQRTWVQPPPECRYGVFYHRRADLGSIPAQVWSSPVVAEVNRQGVWLARLVVLPNRPTTAGRPARPE